MKMSKVIAAAISGTTMMTLQLQDFTSQKPQFREPVLLTAAANKLLPSNHKTGTAPGWILHYTAGCLFTMAYDRIWQKTKMNPTLANGLLLDGVSGIIGAEVWKKIIRLHPDPPAVNLEKF